MKMDHNTIMEIMKAMEEKGENNATINVITDFCRAKQREHAEDAKAFDFKYEKKLSTCRVNPHDILAIIGVQDDPIAIGIFLEHEKELAKKDGDEDAADN
mgnify:CR=1 FL=1